MPGASNQASFWNALITYAKQLHTDVRIKQTGIAHLFATGPNIDPGSDKGDNIFHLAGICFREHENPEEKEWLLNPKRWIPKRLTLKTGIHNPDFENAALWAQVHSEVRSFFADIDVLFIFDIYNQRKWFENFIFADMSNPPVCVDLLLMHQFFLPGTRKVYLEDILIEMVPKKPAKERISSPAQHTERHETYFG